mmetsp:Transcript_29324/g.56995  ORF Transcript_29324/g.56995 Transcript_29324/m.56995 type:complete len:274 (+) Transcript_29324:856-1677(+)
MCVPLARGANGRGRLRRHRDVDKAPGRGLCMAQKMARPTRNPEGRIKPRGPAHPRRNPVAGTGQHTHRHGVHDPLPILPQMKLRQIIGPHQPDKAHTGVTRPQPDQRLRSVPRAKPRFDIRHLHPGMLHHGSGVGQTPRQRGRSLCFQRVTGADQPPHMGQTKPFHRLSGDVHMAAMRRVKGPAKQANSLAGPGQRKGMPHHQVVPLSPQDRAATGQQAGSDVNPHPRPVGGPHRRNGPDRAAPPRRTTRHGCAPQHSHHGQRFPPSGYTAHK